MTYTLSTRERKLLDHLQLDHATYQIPGELPVGSGTVTFERLLGLGLIEAGAGRHGATGYRLTDDGWRCMYGKTYAEMMDEGARYFPLKVWSWPPAGR